MKLRRMIGWTGLLILLAAGTPGFAAGQQALEGFWYGAYLNDGKLGRVSVNAPAKTIDLPGMMVFDLPVKISKTKTGVTLQGQLRGADLQIDGSVRDKVFTGSLAVGEERMPFQARPNLRKIIRGRQIPQFEVTTLDGKQKLSSSDFKGKFTLIDVWATWCGKCQGEVPHLESAYQKYGKDVEFLSISVDDAPEAVAEFREQRFAMPWTHAQVNPTGTLVEEFEIGIRSGGLPLPVLVSPTGTILAAGIDELGGGYRIGHMIERYTASK